MLGGIKSHALRRWGSRHRGLGRLPSRKRRSGFGTGVGGVRGIDGSDFGNTTCRARVPEYLNR